MLPIRLPEWKLKEIESVSSKLISHIGIAVADLEKSISLYETLLGQKVKQVVEVPEEKVRVALFDSSDTNESSFAKIELVAATDSSSPVHSFITKRGEGLHHVCIYVKDFDRRLAELRANGIEIIGGAPRIGAEGNRIAFVHPSSAGGVLLELEELLT